MQTISSNYRTGSIQTTLSPATIAAQQALSNKYGIPTFTYSGQISTVPSIERGYSDINVGLGSYKNIDSLAEAAIKKQVEDETARRKAAGESSDKPITVSDPRTPTRSGDKIINGDTMQKATDFIKDNLPLIGVGIVGLMLLTGGKKRRW